jgi:hypothetical protein
MINKYINLNCLLKANYIINEDLQIKLFKAQEWANDDYLNENLKVKKNPEGINIINFRILNRSNKTLIYNYVYYRSEFCESLIVYFIIRNYYIKRRSNNQLRWKGNVFCTIR